MCLPECAIRINRGMTQNKIEKKTTMKVSHSLWCIRWLRGSKREGKEKGQMERWKSHIASQHRHSPQLTSAHLYITWQTIGESFCLRTVFCWTELLIKKQTNSRIWQSESSIITAQNIHLIISKSWLLCHFISVQGNHHGKWIKCHLCGRGVGEAYILWLKLESFHNYGPTREAQITITPLAL